MTGTKSEEILKKMRAGRSLDCKTPSGFEVTIRPPNIERHALSGGLPARLRDMAARGVEGINESIQEATSGDKELLQYLDGVVARSFVVPAFDPPIYEESLALGDDGEPEKDSVGFPTDRKIITQVGGDVLDDILTPPDYQWALMVAFGEVDRDGEGRRLWGREPLSRFAAFRDQHGCAEDCPQCQAAVSTLSLA